ncbi:transglycosylase domain-containing protein [Paenibacillus mendelii]|uniref:Transglycosylase domain-containing protein n=1 Tax=Paenibacillus mendelii TaxID=206163 RepID=A0ABV6JDL9_9BACL|nr:PBP1A family penicillin-binding protein [Paenibacillus mendelii]MCQ6562404.1 PBP1A family penicillin-binding protein [Paenibacillus mendelii]
MGSRRIGYAVFDLAVVGVLAALAVVCYVHIAGEAIAGRQMDKLHVGSNSIIVDREGHVIATMAVTDIGYREEAALSEMPKLLLDAFVATEDRRFYTHTGIDWIGILRSIRSNVMENRLSQGGSSITQQLARTVYLTNRKSFIRKLNEAGIAMALEKRFSKQQLLELYLNHIYFGRQQVGVKSAARRYFGISDLHQLQLWQIATLAAIPKAPSRYNPVDDYVKSKERRKVVLDLMHEQGLISQRQLLEAEAVDYVPPQPSSRSNRYAAYTDYVVREAVQLTGIAQDDLLTGGYTIVTGLDQSHQQTAEAAFADKRRFPKDGKDQIVQGSAVILDHRTGEIRAIVGGRDYTAGDYNRATRSSRQPGSAFKPIIVYGPALESGKFKANTIVPDKKTAYQSYRPENGGDRYRGAVTIAEAIRLSINSPAVWVLNQVGLASAIQFAGSLGVELDDQEASLAMALGGLHQGVSPLTMAQAYGAFANNGALVNAHAIRMIKDSHGRVIYEHPMTAKQVMSQGTAAAMTAMLRSVVETGTGKQAKLNGRWAAGKTGTTQLGLDGVTKKANRDLWFVGYTSELTAAVWMGFDQSNRDNYMRETSGIAARMFAAIMNGSR